MSNQDAFYKAVKKNDIDLVIELIQKEDVDPSFGNAFVYASINNHLEILSLIIKNSNVTINSSNSWLIKQNIGRNQFESLKMILSIENNSYILKFKEIMFVLKYSFKNNEKLFLNIISEKENNLEFDILFRIIFENDKDCKKINIRNHASNIFFERINQFDEEFLTNIINKFIRYDEINLFKKLYSIMENKKNDVYIQHAISYNSCSVFKFLDSVIDYKLKVINDLVVQSLLTKNTGIIEVLVENPKCYLAKNSNFIIRAITKNITIKGYDKVFIKLINNPMINPLEGNNECIYSLIKYNRYDLLEELLNNPYVAQFSQQDIIDSMDNKDLKKHFINFINVSNF
jgi:hypothetical protein